MRSTDTRGALASEAKGLDFYYQSKIDQLEQQVRAKRENLLRLKAQRNEINTQGASFTLGAALLAPFAASPLPSTRRR